MRKATYLCVLAVSVCASIGIAAEPELKFRPDSYAIHQMHSHYLSASHHAEVLQAYSGDAAAIPKEVLSSHVKLIQRDVAASRKSLAAVPEEKINETKTADDVKAIKKAHGEATKAVKAITEEIGKEQPDVKKIQEHARTITESLSAGESHIFAVHEAWQQNPIHRRLHPGT